MDRRRWCQFRLSTVLWLVVLCAVLAAWWVDRSRLASELEASRNHQVQFIFTVPADPNGKNMTFR